MDLFEFAIRGMKAQAEINKLCNQPLARDTDLITSHKAVDKMVKSGKLSEQEQQVYAQIVLYEERIKNLKNYKQNGVTAKELANWSGLNYWLVQRRLSGLRNKSKIERLNSKGEIYVEGKGQKPMTRDGCCVWRIV